MDPTVLAFLAGAGLPTLLDSLARMMPGKTGARNQYAPSAQLPHRAGMRIESSPQGGTTIAPSMLEAIMQQMQGGGQQQAEQQGPPNAALLQQLAAQRGGVAM